MDRYTVNTAKSQIGFIEIIASPTFEVVKIFIPLFGDFFGNLESNKTIWKSKIDEYDEELSNNCYLLLIVHNFFRKAQ